MPVFAVLLCAVLWFTVLVFVLLFIVIHSLGYTFTWLYVHLVIHSIKYTFTIGCYKFDGAYFDGAYNNHVSGRRIKHCPSH